MEDAEVLKKVKTYIRTSHNKLDDDLTDTIAACKQDLSGAGIRVAPMDETILSAIKHYCKSEALEDPNAKAYELNRYNDQKASLMMSANYQMPEVDQP